jgi:site-specific recombinase XerD
MSMKRWSPEDKDLRDFMHSRSLRNFKRSAVEYARDCSYLERFLREAKSDEKFRLRDAEEADLSAFYFDLLQKISIGSVRRKAASVKSFFQYLKQKGIREDNPTESISLPKEPKREVSALTASEMEQLLEASSWNADALQRSREKALMSLFLTSGIKRAETEPLNLSDFNRKKRTLRIAGGTKRERTVQLRPYTADSIGEYLDNRKKSNDIALFHTISGRRLTARQMWVILGRIASRCKLGKKVTPTLLRDSYSLHQYSSGIGLKELGTSLGHTNLGTTQKYADFAESQRAEADDLFDTLLGMSSDSILRRLQMGETKRIWRKAADRLASGDLDGAITATQSLLETVSKKILDEYYVGGEPAYSPGSTTLAQYVTRALNCVVPPAIADRDLFRSFLRTNAGLIESIASYRRQYGDAHGSSIAREIERHQVEYVVKLASSSATFLVDCYSIKKQLEADSQSLQRDVPLALSKHEHNTLLRVVESGKGATTDRHSISLLEKLRAEERRFASEVDLVSVPLSIDERKNATVLLSVASEKGNFRKQTTKRLEKKLRFSLPSSREQPL